MSGRSAGEPGPGRRNTSFTRHPAITLAGTLVVILALFGAVDFGLGRLRLEKIPGVRSFRYDHDFKPYYSAKARWGSTSYDLVTDSLGFKDESPRNVEAVVPSRRILVLGDSFAEGIGFPFVDSGVGIFARMVGKIGAEVLNAAVSSYTQKLCYLKLKYLLDDRGLKVDDVIVFIDVSDIQDEVLYERYDPSRWTTPEMIRSRIVDRLHAEFYVAHKLIEKYRKYRRRHRVPPEERDFILDPLSTIVDPDTFALERRRWTYDRAVFEKWGRRGLRLAGESMDRIAGLCREREIRLYVVFYPWPEQIRNRDRDGIYSSHWRTFCRERGIPFLDLFPEFIDGTDPDETVRSYYVEGDVHWNLAGNRKVAEALHRFWTADGRTGK